MYDMYSLLPVLVTQKQLNCLKILNSWELSRLTDIKKLLCKIVKIQSYMSV